MIGESACFGGADLERVVGFLLVVLDYELVDFVFEVEVEHCF